MEHFDSDSEDEMPPDWEERVTIDGKVYYANHRSKTTQWEHPITGKLKEIAGELPYGWELQVDDNNQVYFVDHVTGRTTFTDPRLAFAYEKSSGMLRQVYDASTLAREVLIGRDLSKVYAVITGGSAGIGLETAKALSLHGAHIVLPCRNQQKADIAVQEIYKNNPNARVKVMSMDLGNLKSVRDFADAYTSLNVPLNLLILNAGVFGHPFCLTDDGYESTFQINHLGHFYLTQLLNDLLLKSAPARVVVLSSESHRFTDLNINNISEDKLSPSKNQYSTLKQYNLSKLCNLLFMWELHRRFAGSRVACNAVHPGNMISTEITRGWWGWKVLFTLVRPFVKSKEQGAACTVYVSTSRQLERLTGEYFNNCCPCPTTPEAKNCELALKLWALSESMVKKAATLQ